ncbi:MAG: ribosome biogenesis factor YjgA [Thermodesulfobacteriota bacterium]
MEKTEKSRTQKKKEAHMLQKLGEQLLSLTNEQLNAIDLPGELREAVWEAREMTSHGARRRQIKYVGALVREIDPQPIMDALANIQYGDFQKAAIFKQVEKWRDDLREGNTALIEEILGNCPSAQRQRLAQLTRNAQTEYKNKSGVKASRTLFRYLRKVSE